MYTGSTGEVVEVIVEEDARVSLRRLNNEVSGYGRERNKAIDLGEVFGKDGGLRFNLQTARTLENPLR